MKTTLGLIFPLFLNFSISFLPQIFQNVFDAFSTSGRSSNTGPVDKNQSFQCEKTLSTTRTKPSGECGLSVKTGSKGERISTRQGGAGRADLRQTRGR